MIENKRFTVDYDVTTGNYSLHDKEKSNGVDGYIAYLSDEERANNLCDLLNEQEERIKALEEENGQLKQELKSKELNKKILKESLDW